MGPDFNLDTWEQIMQAKRDAAISATRFFKGNVLGKIEEKRQKAIEKPLSKIERVGETIKKDMTNDFEKKLIKEMKQSTFEYFLCMFIKRLVTAKPQIIKDYDTLCHIVT